MHSGYKELLSVWSAEGKLLKQRLYITIRYACWVIRWHISPSCSRGEHVSMWTASARRVCSAAVIICQLTCACVFGKSAQLQMCLITVMRRFHYHLNDLVPGAKQGRLLPTQRASWAESRWGARQAVWLAGVASWNSETSHRIECVHVCDWAVMTWIFYGLKLKTHNGSRGDSRDKVVTLVVVYRTFASTSHLSSGQLHTDRGTPNP